MSVRRWLCAGHAACIAGLSLAPAAWFPSGAAGIPGVDKAVHFFLYAVLGGLLHWSAGSASASGKSRWLPVAGAAFGLLLEALQGGLAGWGRGFSWGDSLANAAGVFGAWFLAARRTPSRRP